MKSLIEKIIRLRNGQFRFDEAVSVGMLLTLLLDKGFALLRGLTLWLRGKNPNGLMKGKGVRLLHLSRIKIGRFVKLEDHVYLSALGKGRLELGNHVSLGAHSRVVVSTSFNNLGSFINIGDNVGIGEFAYLGGGGGLSIGASCIVGQYFSCHPENHEYADPDVEIRHQGVTRKGIVIGRNCWIGSKVTILDGVQIGDNCVIAAGAVVTKSMPANSVIGGVPAKVIKNRIEGVQSISA